MPRRQTDGCGGEAQEEYKKGREGGAVRMYIYALVCVRISRGWEAVVLASIFILILLFLLHA